MIPNRTIYSSSSIKRDLNYREKFPEDPVEPADLFQKEFPVQKGRALN